jgi:hypothetical protein
LHGGVFGQRATRGDAGLLDPDAAAGVDVNAVLREADGVLNLRAVVDIVRADGVAAGQTARDADVELMRPGL